MMYKSEVMDDGGKVQLYVEMDPSERYGRLKDVLGKGATKTVYRAFDEVLGMEVAWNQVKLDNMLKSPEELQRLYSEVHLLKTLSHESIIKFRASWIDVHRRTFNFITELFTSGTLREYRRRYKRVSLGAIKNWARQILEGLEYLHGHNPPVIHRDLKCDNIFVNGHLGQLKIGDLGLAAILKGSQHAHSVIGTPEFMAPELYEETYDELVDVYSFGMCVLEMLTSEYPYNECRNPAQIYKKVTSGKLPESFYKIEDEEARRFISRCLEKAEDRPSARELLNDPFLSIEDGEGFASTKIMASPLKANAPLCGSLRGFRTSSEAPTRSTNMTITGTLNPEDDSIFLKVQISDEKGPARNIFFPFEITSDTALDVATEMVKELEITDWEPFEIAGMILKEITRLVPSWKNPQKQSFINYDDDEEDDDNDDNSPHHPFYANSSFSSSEASLPSYNHAQFYEEKSLSDWIHDEGDDESSESSSCSDKYSHLNYMSANDEEHLKKEAKCIGKGSHKKSTRFGPEGRNINALESSPRPQQRMARTGSLVDIRSQLLHRTLVEEVNKRRMFNTVGALEHIGYRQPDCRTRRV